MYSVPVRLMVWLFLTILWLECRAYARDKVEGESQLGLVRGVSSLACAVWFGFFIYLLFYLCGGVS